MMKKLLVPLAVLLLLALAVPAAFAEVELGMSWTPFSNPNAVPGDPSKNDSITGFHVAYSWFILYGSWDALAMPAFWVQQATSFNDPTSGAYIPGFNVPGFLNLYDEGVRIYLRPFIGYAEAGVNSLYVYGGQTFNRVGANLRLGAGVRFGFWGLNLSGTSVFASTDDLVGVLKALGSDKTRGWAVKQITDGLVPSLNLAFYF
jgi:hypothetical protein